MANTQPSNLTPDKAPETLKDRPFYGLILDDEQKDFRDAIWSKDKDIIFCNAKAGTGKSTISVGVACLLYAYGFYDGITYIVSPTQEGRQGYIPGGMEDKSAPYMEPLYEALMKVGYNPAYVVSTSENVKGMKEGSAFVEARTHTHLRGTNLEKRVVILDEVQNFKLSELKKTLTRCHDSCKVICIGHTGQNDIYKHPEHSGFETAMKLFQEQNPERTAICKLTKNYRGWISTVADMLDCE